MLQEVADSLYAIAPKSILYHYTSLQGLLGIVRTKKLCASDIHYLNDAQELRIFANSIATQVLKRKEQNGRDIHILEQFRDCLIDRTSNGPMMFIGSFTENGNLLSQWRGYCPYGKGVSIGFEPALLSVEASRESFAIGRCLYDVEDHERTAVQVIDHIAATSRHYEMPRSAVQHQSHHGLFLSLEPLLLRIAALIKHPSFKEEAEWRLVSPVLNNYVEPTIAYREGASSLVPYMEIPLPIDSNGALRIRRTIVGPSANPNLSIEAISRFLSKENATPNEVWSSAIPYRQA